MQRGHVDRGRAVCQGALRRSVRCGYHGPVDRSSRLNDRASDCLRGRGFWHGGHGVSGGRGLCDPCGGTLTQLLPRCLSGPCAGIDVAHDVEPFLGLLDAREITHVEPEALAALFATATDKESEAFELGNLHLLERHRRRRRAQVEHEQSRLPSARCRGTGHRRSCIPGPGACDRTGCQCWRCHNSFPGIGSEPRELRRMVRLAGSASVRACSAIVAAPPS